MEGDNQVSPPSLSLGRGAVAAGHRETEIREEADGIPPGAGGKLFVPRDIFTSTAPSNSLSPPSSHLAFRSPSLGRGAIAAGHREAEIREEAESVPLGGRRETVRAAGTFHECGSVEQPQRPVEVGAGRG